MKMNQQPPGNTGNHTNSSGGVTRTYDATAFPKNETKTEPQVNNSVSFDDIVDVPWATDSINFLANKNIITGIGEKKFDPKGNVTREAFAKIVALSFNIYDKTAVSDFVDTKKDDWHYSYIASVKKAGLINGIDQTSYGVGQNITRQDIAVILYKAAILNGKTFETKKTDFNDYDEIADYAKEAVSFLAGAGIINGIDSNNFAPTEFATRAEAAKLIYAFIGGSE